MTQDLDSDLARIRLAAFDVDGILTDGSFLLAGDGREMMRFHTRDGLGLKLLMRGGVCVAFITGRDSDALAFRARTLGIPHVQKGVEDKEAALRKIATEEGVELSDVLFMGDDLPDLPAMAISGMTVTVPEAPPEVRGRARLVTTRPGGAGAVREVAERILKAKGLWENLIAPFAGDP